MIKWLCSIIIGILCCIPFAAFGADHIQVMVLPFEIHAQPDLEYLKDQVPQLIQRYLERDGATIIKLDTAVASSLTGKELTTETVQSQGSKQGADMVVWGSLTWLGQTFSLDAKLIGVTSNQPPVICYADGEGIENLPGSVKTLSDSISAKLFKREKILDIRIAGNKRIEQDAIRRVTKVQPGDTFLAKNLSDDLKAVFAMGYFDDVRVESEDSSGGKIVTFIVKEKPTIRTISIKGSQILISQNNVNRNSADEQDIREDKKQSLIFADDKITKSLDIKPGSILNITKVQSNMKRIEDLYKEKNYYNVKVSYNVQELDNNQADLIFVIDEGKKSYIKQIHFEGNQAYTPKQLKKVMKTSEKGFWSWITSSGDMKSEDLKQDAELLTSYYHNNGYLDAKVGEPTVEFRDNWIYISVKIDEGSRFKVGDVKIVGDMIKPEADLYKKIKIAKGQYFSRETLRNDIITLGDIYSEEGYAFADITPKIDHDREKLLVNITFTISKGNLVYFEGITITGNTKTRDKVIRRELDIYEQELFNGKKLKDGVKNLQRLDYFEDVKVNTNKGSEPDKMLLDIELKEKPTGTFSVGGGYSTVENMFVVGSITQRNLFGRGETLQFKSEIGGTITKYGVSFVEPWLFDIPLTAGVDVYDQTTNYDVYDLDSIGATFHLGYKIFDFTRAFISYGYDVSNMTDMVSISVTPEMLQMAGVHTTSSLTPSIRYDSKDKPFNPTEGTVASVSVQYAGEFLGGDVGFTKYIADLGRYFPLFWDTVGYLHGRVGYLQDHPGELLPYYDRFYLGGINSIRGFAWDQLSPKDSAGNPIGGNKFVQFNTEYIFPVIKDVGLMGLVFFDTGNLYNEDQDIDLTALRKTAGFGIRWYSPMGPLRLEDGFILDPHTGDSTGGRIEFTMGQSY